MFNAEVSRWIDSKKHVASSTLATYALIMGRFQQFLAIAPPKNMEEAAGTLPDFIESLEAHHISGSTIASYVSRVKEFFRFHGIEAVGEYRTTSKEKKRRQKKELAIWFDEKDIEACRSYIFPANHLRNSLIIQILIETGVRVGELTSVRCMDVDIDARTILIGTSKTVMRQVVISGSSAKRLHRYMPADLGSILGVTDGEELLFKITESGISKFINRMLNDLGLNAKGRGPHTFRHWAATSFCFTHGISLEHIALLLGDTPGMIRSTYLHPTPKMLHQIFGPAIS